MNSSRRGQSKTRIHITPVNFLRHLFRTEPQTRTTTQSHRRSVPFAFAMYALHLRCLTSLVPPPTTSVERHSITSIARVWVVAVSTFHFIIIARSCLPAVRRSLVHVILNVYSSCVNIHVGVFWRNIYFFRSSTIRNNCTISSPLFIVGIIVYYEWMLSVWYMCARIRNYVPRHQRTNALYARNTWTLPPHHNPPPSHQNRSRRHSRNMRT